MAKMSNGVILRMPPSCAHVWGGVPLPALSARLACLRRTRHVGRCATRCAICEAGAPAASSSFRLLAWLDGARLAS